MKLGRSWDEDRVEGRTNKAEREGVGKSEDNDRERRVC